ncbi:L-serine dehydratase TdcG [Methyloligella halotolerans]|uniref:L-serine dehydratase n=1 Tax=Methyloligella halotolerans TaxID=1177755 RepID=A0A1E2RZR0_9HYPH|nr:L-serine ammonia-lyase [Methyloligella halotolerans]ODA67701.1 L-serine dehydratase TdcG [Methyloligella halotolerans]
MFLSIFDIFKIGIGPSSSHTMGPMIAASRFLDTLRNRPVPDPVAPAAPIAHVQVRLYGSLAFTGSGHGTDRAVMLGLLGYEPETLDIGEAEKAMERLGLEKRLHPAGLPEIAFDPRSDLIFDYGDPLPGHPNGMLFTAFDGNGGNVAEEIYYSIGGGFVVTADELANPTPPDPDETPCIYPFASARAMLDMARDSGLSISEMKRRNEIARRSEPELNEGAARIWKAMSDCIDRGLTSGGVLPGGLNVPRRAPEMLRQMQEEKESNSRQPYTAIDRLYLYAMAVNEENAAGGRIVTAPTNGAAGVVPSVIRYYIDHCIGADPAKVEDFLLTAAAIGGIIKHNASISGAEAGCQGEVGSAAAMAAAGLCEVLGGTPAQVENAAEIALEHHLGMTCDPVGGLVQIPCIERNGLGAVKAVTAASMALRGNGTHFMPLDNCIAAMRQTGEAMSTTLKETSRGGLAVNLPDC